MDSVTDVLDSRNAGEMQKAKENVCVSCQPLELTRDTRLGKACSPVGEKGWVGKGRQEHGGD